MAFGSKTWWAGYADGYAGTSQNPANVLMWGDEDYRNGWATGDEDYTSNDGDYELGDYYGYGPVGNMLRHENER